jgi:hypothetical protein
MMMNVEDGQYNFNFLNNVLPFSTTLTRASTGWYFDSAGVLQSAANDVARFNHNPTTFALEGLLNEPARTSVIRNSALGGGVAGSPGTFATNAGLASPGTLTRTLAFGTVDGMSYMDVRLNGTTSTTGTNIFFEPVGQVAALTGQTWAWRTYVALIDGSLANINFLRPVFEEYTSVPAFIRTTSDPALLNIVPTGAALRTQGRTATLLLSGGVTTASIRPQLGFVFASGVTIDVTLRIGLPQLELASASSSPIVTTSAAVTRAADVLSLAMIDGTYDIDITRASGVTNVVGTVVSGGAYTVPTDLSPLQSVVARRVA